MWGADPSTPRTRRPITRRLVLTTAPEAVTARAVDLIAPRGKGQLGWVVSPPRTGTTTLLNAVALGLAQNHPECHVVLLLLGEPIEDVTTVRRAVAGRPVEVVATPFDSTAADHIRTATAVLARARELVREGQDAVVLIDSVTRLVRALVAESPPVYRYTERPAGWEAARRLLGAAGDFEGGGSLTILGTLRVDPDSRWDRLVEREFRNTGHVRLQLDASMASAAVWPAIDIHLSGTDKAELLQPDAGGSAGALSRAVADLYRAEAMRLLTRLLAETRTNAELLQRLDT